MSDRLKRVRDVLVRALGRDDTIVTVECPWCGTDTEGEAEAPEDLLADSLRVALGLSRQPSVREVERALDEVLMPAAR